MIGVTKEQVRSIEQQVHEMLSHHPHFRGREGNFSYEYREDALIIRGRVPTYYLKQLLQTALKGVSGVTHIDNRVEVLLGDGKRPPRPSHQAWCPPVPLSKGVGRETGNDRSIG